MNEDVQNELNEEVEETELEEFQAEEDFTEEEEESIDEDVEFDYDDEGNVIIPGESQEETETEENNEEAEVPKEEPKAEETPVPDAKDAEIARLKKLIESNDIQLKETLKSLGIDEKDSIAALEKLAAEAEDTPIEEYRQKKAERLQKEEAVKIVQRQKFEEKKRADLFAINTAFPETKKYKSVEDFPNYARFGALRDLGLSPEEAYSASHSKDVISSAVDSAKQQVRNLSNTKSHLRSNVPVGSRDTSITITKKQMSEYRDIFPELSDKEIIALHKQTNKK